MKSENTGRIAGKNIADFFLLDVQERKLAGFHKMEKMRARKLSQRADVFYHPARASFLPWNEGMAKRKATQTVMRGGMALSARNGGKLKHDPQDFVTDASFRICPDWQKR